ncbi:MAG: TlpA family protein disulfide reductase [Pirellulaceae bacterium]|nr:TlpA family protein disulfide reductase [Pirellulaceae bacterium]
MPPHSLMAQADPAGATESSAQAQQNFPDLTIPAGADVPTLQRVVAAAKSARPTSADEYKAQQTAVRQASSALLRKLSKEDAAYAQAEMDTIISSVALLTFFNEDEQSDIVDQLTNFLKGRNPLSIQDIQTGMLAAGMLELQPDKQPAREVYELLDELLKEDQRDEMQSLRLNLQASVRRLNMLGEPFELNATTIQGEQITTQRFAGKFVIVDVFATWCEPCRVEAALIKKHYEKYRERGLEVVGISLDEDAEALRQYLKDNPLPWPVIHDAAEDPLERLSFKYGISALPTVLLLNKEGTVVSLEARQSELNRLMQMLFETPTPAVPPTDAADDGEASAENDASAGGVEDSQDVVSGNGSKSSSDSDQKVE